jgi:NADH:ubiquinone reductase (H+-translocating)
VLNTVLGALLPMVVTFVLGFIALVSLGKLSTVGNLMGFPFIRNIFVEGLFARLMYRTLRLMHDRAIGGTSYAVLRLIVRALARRTGPPVKLH